MAKKSNKGQRNFFRVMALIGVIVIIFIVNEFLNAAPALPNNNTHKGPPPAKTCLECHVQGIKNTPIMPHRRWDNCSFCHKNNTPTKVNR